MKTIIILTAAALTGLTATASVAQNSVAVSYADLDTGTDAGMATLTHRVKTAAKMVCVGTANPVELADRLEIVKCRSLAITSAMQAFAAKNAPKIASR